MMVDREGLNMRSRSVSMRADDAETEKKATQTKSPIKITDSYTIKR